MAAKKPKRLKKAEIKRDGTYFLCPDSSCKLFWEPNCMVPCERGCPKQDELVKIILCVCGEMVELPGNHSAFNRVDHRCSNGYIASNFQRGNHKYYLIYEKPEE